MKMYLLLKMVISLCHVSFVWGVISRGTSMSPKKGLFEEYIFQPLIFRGHVSKGVLGAMEKTGPWLLKGI